MRIYQQNSTCVRTTVKGEARGVQRCLRICISVLFVCLYLLELSCSKTEDPEPSRNQQVTCRFEKGDKHHQTWFEVTSSNSTQEFRPAATPFCFEFNESLVQQTVQFPPSLSVKSPGLYFMHLRFAQRCLAHAALMPTLQSGGRWGDCFNEGWTVWENCWRLEVVVDLLHIYIRFVGPPKWTSSSLVKFRTVIQPDCDKMII